MKRSKAKQIKRFIKENKLHITIVLNNELKGEDIKLANTENLRFVIEMNEETWQKFGSEDEFLLQFGETLKSLSNI